MGPDGSGFAKAGDAKLGKYVSTAPGQEENAYKSFVLPPPCQRSISRELRKQEEGSTYWGCRVWVKQEEGCHNHFPAAAPAPFNPQLHQYYVSTGRQRDCSALAALVSSPAKMQVIILAIPLGLRKVDFVNECLK